MFIKKYKTRIGCIDYFLTQLKYRTLKFLMHRDAKFYTLLGDGTLDYSILDGTYSPDLIKFFDLCNNEGYGDFLLDIGANTGLVACSSLDKFSIVHSFEPNPYTFNILENNIFLNKQKGNIIAHKIALGEQDEKSQMYIPYNNLGAAFLMNDANSYLKATDSVKDYLYGDMFEKNKYDVVDVEVKNTKNYLANIFKELSAQNYKKGVVKIDVEGCELSILNAISQIIPDDFSVVIIFESFTAGYLNMDKIIKSFNRPVDANVTIFGGLFSENYKQRWIRLLLLPIFTIFRQPAVEMKTIPWSEFKPSQEAKFSEIILKVAAKNI